MSRRQPIPGVDEAALDALAGQFPSGSPRPVAPLAHDQALLKRGKAPPAQDNAPPTHGKKGIGTEVNGLEPSSPALPETSPRKAAGRGLAVGAMMLALLAVLIAVSAVMPPPARLWLARTLGDTDIVNFVTGGRADTDKRLTAAAQSIDALASKQDALASKEDARASKEIEIAARLGWFEASESSLSTQWNETSNGGTAARRPNFSPLTKDPQTCRSYGPRRATDCHLALIECCPSMTEPRFLTTSCRSTRTAAPTVHKPART